ncbi:outer membrane protein TolC precursor [bacterium BMS3Abin04]|nr:outer membrane protein TolC precursor [bacterium BMS3Abin04]
MNPTKIFNLLKNKSCSTKLKMILLLLFFLNTATIILAQENVFTLDQSLKIGLENSKEIKIAKSKLLGSEAKVTEVSSQMLPQLSFSAKYIRLSDVPPFQVDVPFLPKPISIQETILNNYNLGVSVKQPLFTGFRLSSLKSSANMINLATESEVLKTKNNIALNIRAAYWNFYKVKKVVGLIDQNLISVKKHLEDAQNFYANGMITKSDLLKLKVRYSNLKIKRIEAANNLSLARIAFNKAIGFNLNSETEIADAIVDTNLVEQKLSELISEALKNRSELKSIHYQIEAGKEITSASRADWFPQVFLFGDYYYNRPNQRYLPLQDKFNDTWDVGVALNWKLWDWGNTSSKVDQAEQKVLQAETTANLMKEGIELEVRKNYLNMISQKNKIYASLTAMESAKEDYRITKNKFDQQLISASEFIDAESSLLEAKTNYTISQIDFEITKTKLKKAVGEKIY